MHMKTIQRQIRYISNLPLVPRLWLSSNTTISVNFCHSFLFFVYLPRFIFLPLIMISFLFCLRKAHCYDPDWCYLCAHGWGRLPECLSVCLSVAMAKVISVSLSSSLCLSLSLQHTHTGIHINGQFDYAILCLILRSWLKLSLSLYFFFSLSLDTLLKKSLSLISHKHTRQTHTNTIRPTLCLVLRPWLRSATKILLKVRILIYNWTNDNGTCSFQKQNGIISIS